MPIKTSCNARTNWIKRIGKIKSVLKIPTGLKNKREIIATPAKWDILQDYYWLLSKIEQAHLMLHLKF